MKRLFLYAGIALLSAVVALPAQAKKDKKKKGNKKEFVLQKPALQTAGDSTAYLFGISQSNGLKRYMVSQLQVDTAYINQFVQGIMDRASVDPQDKELHAYTAGQSIGAQIENMTNSFAKDYYKADPEKTVDTKIVAAAIVEGLLGKSEITPDSAMQQFRTVMTEREKENMETLYGPNRKQGEEFLAANKTKDGVVTLPSGLQYKVITKGEGAIPTATSKVKVNYEGHLIDGTEFDSSYKRKQPATFKANQVIKGWTEALCLMPVGSKWELYIPYDLAYGDRDSGKIKPYSTLIFTVELLDIIDETKPAETTATSKSATLKPAAKNQKAKKAANAKK